MEKNYKTSEASRKAVKKYTDKNTERLNAKKLEYYHTNMKNPEFAEKRRMYGRLRKQKKAIIKKSYIDEDIPIIIHLDEKVI